MTFDALVTLRRALHQIPELAFEEHETSAFLYDMIEDIGQPVAVGGTGLFVDIGPDSAPMTLLLRADMDGLPVREETGLRWASRNAGFMHACGHDAHMAALIHAGKLLAAAPPHQLRLRLLFQPAEEGGGGAKACIGDGVLEGVDAVFGLHVWNELPLGSMAVTRGGIMAGVVEFNIVFHGRGGHGALPHRTIDPIVAAAQVVTGLQTIASRLTSPLDAVVVTVGALQAGEHFNVIPDVASIKGTVRSLSMSGMDAAEAQLRRIVEGVALAAGVVVDVEWKCHAVPTVNHVGMSDLVVDALQRMTGVDTVLRGYRCMAGEDFGEFLKLRPGCFVLVGSANAARGLTAPHHSPRFEIDEAVLPLACDLHRAVAAEFAESGGVLLGEGCLSAND